MTDTLETVKQEERVWFTGQLLLNKRVHAICEPIQAIWHCCSKGNWHAGHCHTASDPRETCQGGLTEVGVNGRSQIKPVKKAVHSHCSTCFISYEHRILVKYDPGLFATRNTWDNSALAPCVTSATSFQIAGTECWLC